MVLLAWSAMDALAWSITATACRNNSLYSDSPMGLTIIFVISNERPCRTFVPLYKDNLKERGVQIFARSENSTIIHFLKADTSQGVKVPVLISGPFLRITPPLWPGRPYFGAVFEDGGGEEYY